MTAELKVAFPLGIGDCHWGMQKIAGLKAKYPQHSIKGYVNESPDHKSWEYLKLLPEIDWAEYSGEAPMVHDLDGGYQHARWTNLDGCRGWRSFDFVFFPNAWVEAGRPIGEWLPELTTQYKFEYRYPQGVEQRSRNLMPDPEILLYLSGVGPNQAFHGGTWKDEHWITLVAALNRAGYEPILVGAPSKQDYQYRDRILACFNASGINLRYRDLIGQTSIPDYVRLIERCACWVGLNSGGGIVSASAQTPTVMFWADSRWPKGTQHFEPAMQTAWLTACHLATYRPVSYGSPHADPGRVAETVLEIVR